MRKQPTGKIVFVHHEPDEKVFLEESLSRLIWDIQVVCSSGINGLEFKQQIDSDPKLVKRAIPFIFSSSSASREEVSRAYDYRIQGYFQTPDNLYEMAEMLNAIIQYPILGYRKASE